jgi:hypothetical protein
LAKQPVRTWAHKTHGVVQKDLLFIFYFLKPLSFQRKRKKKKEKRKKKKEKGHAWVCALWCSTSLKGLSTK